MASSSRAQHPQPEQPEQRLEHPGIEGEMDQRPDQAPIGRAAQPVELAPAYVFLASQESSYVAGETIGVTGGTPLP
jgi:NAD(P)-dependent dehydrogenase (short-subunit alcohol dehydrogenase family)